MPETGNVDLPVDARQVLNLIGDFMYGRIPMGSVHTRWNRRLGVAWRGHAFSPRIAAVPETMLAHALNDDDVDAEAECTLLVDLGLLSRRPFSNASNGLWMLPGGRALDVQCRVPHLKKGPTEHVVASTGRCPTRVALTMDDGHKLPLFVVEFMLTPEGWAAYLGLGLDRTDAGSDDDSTLDDESLYFHSKLAKAFGLPVEALRKRLDRWRAENLSGWVENTEHGSRESKYLYRLGSVRTLLDELDAASSKRPAKEKTRP